MILIRITGMASACLGEKFGRICVTNTQLARNTQKVPLHFYPSSHAEKSKVNSLPFLRATTSHYPGKGDKILSSRLKAAR